MKIGYSPGGFYPQSTTPSAAVERTLELVEVALDAGYDYVQKGDHHVVSDGQYLQNVPMGARFTEYFDRVGVMWLLPMYDPVLVAEQAGTIDALATEFDFWCALGYEEKSFEAFGVPKRERAPRMEEQLELIGRLWTEESVTFEGEFYQVEDVSVNPKADPRICIGGNAEPAVKRAGRFGDAWIASSTAHDDLSKKINWFEQAGGGDVLVRQDAHVTENREAADTYARGLIEDGYRGWDLDADYLSGDPEAVVADLEAFAEMGVDEVIIRPMDRDYAEETIRGIAKARELLSI